jgi:ubiquinone/menaquinone biosynthesis C-methylase UbiE
MAAGIDIDARLREIDRIKDVKGLFQTTGIHYIAPGDASQTNLPEKSIDVHFSVTVLEHVEPNALNGILREARRMLKPNGVAIHMID